MAWKKWWMGVAAALAFGTAAPAATLAGDDDASGSGSAGSDAMFEYLVAELATQRGDPDAAIAIFDRLAHELRDPRIARRAVETAIRAREFGAALDSAALLLELDPVSSLGREIVASLLANQGEIAKARPMVSGMLEKSTNRGPLLMQLSYFFAKFKDKAAVLDATEEIVKPYTEQPEAHYAVGVAAFVAGKMDLAAAESDKALAINPAWEDGAILKAQILRRSDPSKVVDFYQAFVERHPQSPEVRMQLGRELASEHKLADAREQFREVEKISHSDSQAVYADGLLSLQLEDFPAAQSAFSRALKLGYRDSAAVYLGLGQAAEGQKRYEEAIDWYRKVESGDWVRAQLKIATLIARQQGLEAGRHYLRQIQPKSTEDQIQVVQVEAQLLRDAKEWNETYDLLTKAVAKYPDSYELLYDHAMAAERIGHLDILEKDLKRVIEMKPDYAHAYNALGYTLAEKTDRLAEAKALIEKAYKLAPDDPFIIDSLGWVEYRLGHVQQALKQLQIAYSSRPDPEIAAHLGEVLWKSGQHDQAKKIWRAALSENPNHESLLAVMQKFEP